eukprot:gene5362-5749_t
MPSNLEIPESDEPFIVGDETEKLSPKYKRQGSLYGYTGHYPGPNKIINEIDSPNEKYMIRGYTGHRPQRSFVVGEPIVPNEKKQVIIRTSSQDSMHSSPNRDVSSPSASSELLLSTFRNFGKHMDTLERYHTAVEHLIKKGQTQETLLRIVQAKMSQRVNSFSAQLIRTRKMFEAFDLNNDGVLDENEFRICLEKLNIQFDDVQVLALFAYFDVNNDGYVEWKDFADHAMVQNPRGGTAVFPKMITSSSKQNGDLHSIKGHPYYSKAAK